MAMEVEEAFPSFSTERIRSKLQVRDGPVTQRRLDYNAPLLSVRRLTDAGGDARSKVWKLSGELSKMPLRVPGAVPFTWEHSPGRPKQPESPPRAPSSPSPPSTPSPPSSRRASPASPTLPPPPPSLRPLFLRSNSSTLFAPPPPPPPPPPPLPCMQPLPLLTRRSAPCVQRRFSISSSPPPQPPLPPPPPPPPLPPTMSHVPKQASAIPALQQPPDHERMRAFRLVDPSEGFLRLLRARREKAEPELFLAAEAAEETSREVVVPVETAVESAKISPTHDLFNDDGNNEVASINDNSSCVVVDAMVQRFLEDHPDPAAEEATSAQRQDDEVKLEDDQASLNAGSNDNVARQGEDLIAGAIDPCSINPLQEDTNYISVLHVVCSDEGPVEGESTQVNCVPTPTWENSELENGDTKVFVCTSASPSSDVLEVPSEEGHKQSLIKKEQNMRCTSSIAILDSCRVESLRMIKSTLMQLCRKAAAASLRTLSKAKRRVTPSCRTSSSLDLVVHCTSSKALNKGGSDYEEEAAVREVKATLQLERLSQETEQQQSLVSTAHSPPISPPRSSTALQEDTESASHNKINTAAKRDTPISPSKSPTDLQASIECTPCSDTNNAVRRDILSSPPHLRHQHGPVSPSKSSTALEARTESTASSDTNNAVNADIQSSPLHFRSCQHGSPDSQPAKKEDTQEIVSTTSSASKSSTALEACTESTPFSDTNNAVNADIQSSPLHFSSSQHGSPDSQPTKKEDTQEILSTTSSARHSYAKSLGGNEWSSAHHVYAKSLGGDEPNEFYDASSRFGSRSSTPSRTNLNRSLSRSMSKDWGTSDDFLDATSTPFETPRTSVSDSKYAFSDSEGLPYSNSTASKVVSRTRPTSKLSKRVGKALWVETREANAGGKGDAITSNGFLSGELFTSSKESLQVLNKKEMNASRRKYVSGDQQASSSSTSDGRRQNRRGVSRSTDAKTSSHVIAVTPVFPSKCQKNRSVASASGLPQQISTGNMAEMGWPLGISGYPPVKASTKGKEERKREGSKPRVNNIMPSPPLPPTPAGGSWLKKALSSSNHVPSRLGGLHAMANPSKKVEPPSSPGNKWEDIVKGSHVRPGHLRFSEELQHRPPSNSNPNKYYVS